MTGFIIGITAGAIIIVKIIKEHNAEIERINKSWRQELEHKNDYIKTLEHEKKAFVQLNV